MRGRVRTIRTVASTLLIISFAIAGPGLAATKKKKKKKPKWNYDNSFQILQTLTQSEPISELTNPDNRVYQLPLATASTEFRPEIKGTYTKRYRLTLRPRLRLQQDYRLRDTPEFDQFEKKTDAFLNEANLATTHTPSLQTVIGLQNYQWGPAELISPSNPIFRDLGLDKSFFFETRGKALARFNASPTGQFSIVGIVEPIDNGTVRPLWDPTFHPSALVKAEYSDATQTDYIGYVIAIAEKDRVQQGLYAHYEVFTGLTVYADASVRYGSRAWYPVVESQVARFEQNRIDSPDLEAMALAGFRYVTEGGWDYRLEGLHDDGGWTLEERDAARFILSLAPTKDNLEYYLKPGTLLPGQDFAYGSLRIPDWGPKNSLTLSLRVLHSLADNTEKQTILLDSYIGDNFVLNGGVTNSSGPENGELTQGFQWSVFIAGAYNF